MHNILDQGVKKLSKHLWPNKTVPVNLTNPLLPEDHKKLLRYSMQYVNNHTCLRFMESKKINTYHQLVVMPTEEKFCSNTIGYLPSSSLQQLMVIAPSCCVSNWHLIHELLLVAGLYPEQRHFYRDKYIDVHEKNIKPKYRGSYKKLEGNLGLLMTQGLPYDYMSLMHFPQGAFALNKSLPTMTVKHWLIGTLGQRQIISATDVARINRLYGCWNYYTGDDINGAVPYKIWNSTLMSI
ncbi:zinc metalloproteinase nas-7-like [Homarus americanus]|uniref:zinc metalloproteinase nas-7-like n=1 Tax=Homarus americanus TaxID=6706 RepID=UPI001C457F77|nr:zinc metalloproteinase nas-7-like [Homarus americanus]